MSETEGTTPAPESASPAAAGRELIEMAGDEIRVSRPSWMPVETWVEVKARMTAKLDEVVELIAGEVVDQ